MIWVKQMWYLIVSIPDPCCLSYFKGSHILSSRLRPVWCIRKHRNPPRKWQCKKGKIHHQTSAWPGGGQEDCPGLQHDMGLNTENLDFFACKQQRYMLACSSTRSLISAFVICYLGSKAALNSPNIY